MVHNKPCPNDLCLLLIWQRMLDMSFDPAEWPDRDDDREDIIKEAIEGSDRD